LKAKVSYHKEASLEEEDEEEVMGGSSKDIKYDHAENMVLAQWAFIKK
jgi:hypothetical protein